jgi:hypothetical protein
MDRRQRTCIVALLACVAASSLAVAQPIDPLAAPLWCNGIVDVDASAKTEAHWRSRWRDVGLHWYSAYIIGPAQKNPFDLTGKAEPAHPPVFGFIWASGVTCQMTPGELPNETVVRVTATVIAFNEKSRWAPALNNVLLLDASFGAPGERRRVVDRSPETGVIAPDLKLRVPTLAELPKPSRQLKLPCRATESWKSKRCMP